MEYARTRSIAEELTAYAEHLEGAWTVEIGPSGPFLAMMSPSKRHEGTVRRIRNQLNDQLPATHPGYICAVDATRHEGEALPEVGNRAVVVDSAEHPVAVIEVTDVRVVPLAKVDLDHALDEGEGHTTVAEWRADHERFWDSEEMRAAMDDPAFTVDDSTLAVLERFRLVADLRVTG
jgi:uncharacterized protein YhfF